MRWAIALATSLTLAGCLGAGTPASLDGAATPNNRGRATAVAPHASHVTIVLMENREYDLVAGNAAAPYFNKTLVPQGVLMRNSHAIGHPSEPNYVALFSGSTHGLTGDDCPVTFSSADIASQLAAKKSSFIGWAESLPRAGYTGCGADDYARKHAPWVDFTNVPASQNRPYTGWNARAQRTSFNWITPNLCNDMHDCSTQTGDAWLSKNLPPIIAWDATHDGLLVLTWDEADPDSDGTNHIPTVLVGPMIVPGAKDTQHIDHYAVLHTIESIFGIPCIAKACRAPLLTGIWK
jgi:acid phosphatase